ncbi:hypothetical protein QQF64_008045 [Cirrhinus molitorella]|uniref:Uncharacterized protein n=1 Tax=Cirrhinus molitorella TaxID=172907 RepID=A0ABR3M516_9TELE
MRPLLPDRADTVTPYYCKGSPHKYYARSVTLLSDLLKALNQQEGGSQLANCGLWDGEAFLICHAPGRFPRKL